MKYFALLYGLIIALSYQTIKTLAQSQFIIYFTFSCGLLLLITIFTLRKPPKQFTGIVIRGLLYAVTNFILLSVQNENGVSSALTAALLGSLVIGLPPILKNLSRYRNIIIVLSLIVSVFLLHEKLALSALAVACGLLQAGTYSIAGKLMKLQHKHLAWNLASGFFWTFIIGLFILEAHNNLNQISLLSYSQVLIIAIVIAISQISFFTLYTKFPVEDASRYSLGRIPWAYLLELSTAKTTFIPQVAIGTILLFIAAFIRQERRAKSR